MKKLDSILCKRLILLYTDTMPTLYTHFLSHVVDKFDGSSKYQNALDLFYTNLAITPIQKAFRNRKQMKKYDTMIKEQGLTTRNTYWKYATYNIDNINDCRDNKFPVYCLYCQSNLDPSKINEYCDSNNTAICYKCDVDAVIPESNRFTKEELNLWRYIGFGLFI